MKLNYKLEHQFEHKVELLHLNVIFEWVLTLSVSCWIKAKIGRTNSACLKKETGTLKAIGVGEGLKLTGGKALPLFR